ncbi:MerR family DNA-binding transcriptional regulator [Paenibacillus terrigena]|uniref:MerR family DNA-binding transcriptional regulator n=1 Tax=Paenibacillus terrigena TaxID=369333 RepID=UPI0037C76546
MQREWKVGELAKMAGLTVRTLRFYEQIGLFYHRAITNPIAVIARSGCRIGSCPLQRSHRRQRTQVQTWRSVLHVSGPGWKRINGRSEVIPKS